MLINPSSDDLPTTGIDAEQANLDNSRQIGDSAMSREKRKGLPPVPDDLRQILSLAQKIALKELESFGWEVEYVRRPLFQEPRVIVRNPQTGKHSIVEADGTVDHSPVDLVKRQGDT